MGCSLDWFFENCTLIVVSSICTALHASFMKKALTTEEMCQSNRELINDFASKTMSMIRTHSSNTMITSQIDFHSRSNPEFTIRNRTRYATVQILPEIELSHPIYGHDSNSLSKFRRNEQLKGELLKYQSKSLTWPDFVYKMYDVSIACDKIKKFLSKLKIGNCCINLSLSTHVLNGDSFILHSISDTVPMDLVAMSFWFCQNAILSTECRRKAFLTNNVLERILLVCQTLEVNDKKLIVLVYEMND